MIYSTPLIAAAPLWRFFHKRCSTKTNCRWRFLNLESQFVVKGEQHNNSPEHFQELVQVSCGKRNKKRSMLHLSSVCLKCLLDAGMFSVTSGWSSVGKRERGKPRITDLQGFTVTRCSNVSSSGFEDHFTFLHTKHHFIQIRHSVTSTGRDHILWSCQNEIGSSLSPGDIWDGCNEVPRRLFWGILFARMGRTWVTESLMSDPWPPNSSRVSLEIQMEPSAKSEIKKRKRKGLKAFPRYYAQQEWEGSPCQRCPSCRGIKSGIKEGIWSRIHYETEEYVEHIHTLIVHPSSSNLDPI